MKRVPWSTTTQMNQASAEENMRSGQAPSKRECLQHLVEYRRLREANPFLASAYSAEHGVAISGAYLVIDALQAASEAPVTPQAALALVEDLES